MSHTAAGSSNPQHTVGIQLQVSFARHCRDDGVGLAAPQVGVNIRLMVFNETGRRGAKEEMVLVNPKVVSSNKQISVYEEGCLSFPKIFADVEVSGKQSSTQAEL